MLLPDLVRRIQACQLILLFLLPRTLTRGEMLHRPPLRGMRPRKNLSFLHLPALMQAEAQSVLQAQDQHPDEMVSTQCLPHQMGQEKQPAGCQMTVLPFLSLQPLPTLAASPGLLHPWLRNLSFPHLQDLLEAKPQGVLQAPGPQPEEKLKACCLPHEMRQEMRSTVCRTNILRIPSQQTLQILAAQPALQHPWFGNHQRQESEPSMSRSVRPVFPEQCWQHGAWARSQSLPAMCCNRTTSAVFAEVSGQVLGVCCLYRPRHTLCLLKVWKRLLLAEQAAYRPEKMLLLHTWVQLPAALAALSEAARVVEAARFARRHRRRSPPPETPARPPAREAEEKGRVSAVLPAPAARGTEGSAQPAGGRRPAPRSRPGTGRSPRGAGRRPAPPPSGSLPVRRGSRRPASSPGRAAASDGRRGGTSPGSGRPAAPPVGRRRRGTEAAKSPPAEPERLPPRPASGAVPARAAAPRRAGARPSSLAPRSSSRPRAEARSHAPGGAVASSRSRSPESERHSLRGTSAPRGGPASQWPSGATPARVTKPRRVPQRTAAALHARLGGRLPGARRRPDDGGPGAASRRSVWGTESCRRGAEARPCLPTAAAGFPWVGAPGYGGACSAAGLPAASWAM